MKKLLLILLCLPFIGFGQSVPQGINYQAVARDSTGPIGSGFSMNSSPAVQFGSLVCGNSDNNSLLIHLNTK